MCARTLKDNPFVYLNFKGLIEGSHGFSNWCSDQTTRLLMYIFVGAVDTCLGI